MEHTNRIVKAIERYDAWELPWQFFAAVSADPSLDEDDRRVLTDLWTAACEARLWVSGTLEQGRANTEAALAEHFPWLSPAARRQLANAAAYQWR